MLLAKSSNIALTPEQIFRAAPSVFQQEAHESRSDDYVHVPTTDVLDRLHQEGFRVTQATQSRTRIAGKREFTKHLLRLAHVDAISKAPIVGGSRPEIVLLNSHDGGSSFSLELGVFRLVCSNGLVVGDRYASERVKHLGTDVLDNVIEGTYRVLQAAPLVTDQIARWSSTQVSAAQANELARRVAVERWGQDENGNIQSPLYSTDYLTRANRYEDRTSDAWTILNRIQENVIRGGQPGRAANGRRQSTRAVTGVDQTLNLNRAIWTLAEEVFA